MKFSFSLPTITMIFVVLATVSSCGTSKPVGPEPDSIPEKITAPIDDSNKALKPEEVDSIAEKITVRIDGASTGSGVIIERKYFSHYTNYTVVTNWHVVQLEGNYTIQTFDGSKYTINHRQVKRLPGVDLAFFQFRSNKNHRAAEKGSSAQLTRGKTIYIGGYPDGTSGIRGRNFKFLTGEISSILSNPKNGYALDYTVQAFKGMSGGPILDDKGKLVGINGLATTQFDGGGIAVLGIPLNTYLTLVEKTQPVAIAPKPEPQNINNNNTAGFFLNRGNKRFKSKNYQGAIADLTKAIEINPNYAPAYYIRGLTRYELRDYQGAIADYTKAIEINPNDALAYNIRGFTRVLSRDKQRGIRDLHKAIELYRKQGREAKAQEVLEVIELFKSR